MRRSKPAVHAIGCRCKACEPKALHGRRAAGVAKAAIRAFFLIAVLFAVPFIVAHALASAKGEQR